VASPAEGAEGAVGLRIDAVPRSTGWLGSVEERQERARRELWGQGISIARRVERLPSGVALGSPGLLGLYRTPAHDHEDDFEVRFAHRDVEGWSIDYTAITASPSHCALDHMRAARALEIAVATTQIETKERTTDAA